MPVPSAITDLSQTAGSNSPAGSESPTTTDDYLRAGFGFIATLRDGKGFSTEVDLASGATCDIGGQNAFFVRITGTTTITSFGTNYNGPRFIRFAGALTLTHNASTLILPTGANITTAAGDTCVAVPIGGGGWAVAYQKASGLPLMGVLTSGTVQSPVAVAAANFTSIPPWVTRITIMFSDISTDGTSNLHVQIGDSGGIETAGYLGSASSIALSTVASVNHTAGFGLTASTAATSVLHGSMVLTLIDASTNTWVSNSTVGASDITGCQVGAGSKSLSATLDRLRITTVSGAPLLDNGKLNVLYE